MTANRRRGEVAADLDGRPYRLCLTLGALAELEAAYAADDLGALVERFGTGRLSARDLIRILGAGLRGGGNAVSDDEVAAMYADSGVAGFAAIVADLLTQTFGAAPVQGTANPLEAAAGGQAGFPWDRVMAFGFGALRLSPNDFWAMTPREIERAMGFGRSPDQAPLRRAEFDALTMAFPDKGLIDD